MEDADTDLQISSSQDSLMEAALAALGTGDMTPLVKEELKLTIQSRRLASGKGELRVNFEPPTQSELTEEERVKVDRRREQNRMAAQRFRQKQKTLGDRVQKQVRGLETDNTRLRAELRLLREERDDLRRRLTEHLKVCPGVSLYVVNTWPTHHQYSHSYAKYGEKKTNKNNDIEYPPPSPVVEYISIIHNLHVGVVCSFCTSCAMF